MHRLRFGKFRGKDIRTVPAAYLEHLLTLGFVYRDTRALIEAELARRQAVADEVRRLKKLARNPHEDRA